MLDTPVLPIQDVKTKIISLPLPMHMGSVNCYLLQAGNGFVLIDTAGTNNRKELLLALEEAGCKPGLLKLIVITHGDFDHTGNANALREQYGAKIAMHPGDAGMAEQGDMFFNRKKPNVLIRMLLPLFSGLKKVDRFTPDLSLSEGESLAEFGLEAQVLSIPGHSKGSIGILTAEGDFFCGDLMTNTDKPGLISLIDNLAEANASLSRLGENPIRMVYPGHGKPFTLDQLEELAPGSS